MEVEYVSKNLISLLMVVQNEGELLITANAPEVLEIVSKEEYENPANVRGKDRAKFVIAKTITYAPSVLDGNLEMKETFNAQSAKIINYLSSRNMNPIGDLIKDYITNEKAKDALHYDYYYKDRS